MAERRRRARVRFFLLLEELHVRVEQVALRHVNALAGDLVHELKDARRDGRLARLIHVQELALRCLVAKHIAVEGREGRGAYSWLLAAFEGT